MASDEWTWDPTLYGGSAPFYPGGRVAYPPELPAALATALATDGSGCLVDVGCGPGSLTLLLAPLFADVVGIDADPDMLAEGARQASLAGVHNVTWRHLRAESLPVDVPTPTVVSFAQSFHWTDRPRVAAAVRSMLPSRGQDTRAIADRGQSALGTSPCPRSPLRPALRRTSERLRCPHQ